MTPTEAIVVEAREAVAAHDGAKALEVCKRLSEQDLFVGIRAPANRQARNLITLAYPARCNYCSLSITTGMDAVWMKGKGVWHEECYDTEQPK